MDTLELALIYFIIINGIAFVLMGSDKRRAKRNEWRISEQTLLTIAIIGGAVGMLSGLKLYRHKTKKALFIVGLPLILLVHTFLLFMYLI